MRVDIHTHLWPPEDTTETLKSYFAGRGMTVEDTLSLRGLLDSIDGYCDAALVATLAPGSRVSNEELKHYHSYVKQAVDAAQGKILALCTVDPFGGEESVRALAHYIEDLGFVGLKLHPNIQSFYPNDERVYPIYAKLQSYGLPVLFHSGGIGITPFIDRYADCQYIEEVACRFPDMPIIMGHAGRGKHFDVASILRKHKNVYADVSANFAKLAGYEYHSLMELIKTVKIWMGSTDKLLFGSDYPFYDDRVTAAALSKVAQNSGGVISDEDVQNILEKNAGAFLDKYVFSNLQRK